MYTMEKSTDGGMTWTTVLSNGVVPPPNIGPRSIESGVGLDAADYATLMTAAIRTASSGEMVYCGPADDPVLRGPRRHFRPRRCAAPDSGGIVRDGLATFQYAQHRHPDPDQHAAEGWRST